MADIKLFDSDGVTLLGTMPSSRNLTAMQLLLAVADERCFLVSKSESDHSIIFLPEDVISPGEYIVKLKRIRRGVSDKDVLPFVGLLVENDDKAQSRDALNCITSTQLGFVSTLHGLSSFRELEKKGREASWTMDKIPSWVKYFFRSSNGVDTELHPVQFNVSNDLICFEVGSETPNQDIPQAKISSISPLEDEVRDIIFVHWSPNVSIQGYLISDHGYVVGASGVSPGVYIASLRSHSGSCGGGVFFSTNGELAGIHQGIEHESASEIAGGKQTMKKLREDLESLKGEKAAYTYFIGSKTVTESFEPAIG